MGIKVRNLIFSSAQIVHVYYFILIALHVLFHTFAEIWLRVEDYYEFPDIHFKYKLLLTVDTSKDGDYIAWSTYQNFNQLQMDNLRVPLIKVSSDGYYE